MGAKKGLAARRLTGFVRSTDIPDDEEDEAGEDEVDGESKGVEVGGDEAAGAAPSVKEGRPEEGEVVWSDESTAVLRQFRISTVGSQEG